MIGNNYLIDTSIVIEIFDGNKLIADKLHKAQELFISSIVVGELYVGINRVSNKAKHLKKLLTFLDLCTIVNVDTDTAKHYGELIATLHKNGTPIPTNDVWIAAIAVQHNLALVTKDNHFKQIKNIDVTFL